MSDSFSSADEIKKLYGLLQDGIISQAEFDSVRKRIIAGEQPGQKSRIATRTPPVSIRSETEGISSPLRRGILIICGLLVLAFVINGLLPERSEDDDITVLAPTQSPALAQGGSTVAATEPIATSVPTATAIPRTGIQTIRLWASVGGDWEAWGEGCVGGGDADWVTSSTGVVIAPAGASGTFQGREMGAGVLVDEGMCSWSVKLTSRAADAYRIKIGDHDVVCHSNQMSPTDDGFIAAVTLDGDGVHCATVVDVMPGTATPDASPNP